MTNKITLEVVCSSEPKIARMPVLGRKLWAAWRIQPSQIGPRQSAKCQKQTSSDAVWRGATDKGQAGVKATFAFECGHRPVYTGIVRVFCALLSHALAPALVAR